MTDAERRRRLALIQAQKSQAQERVIATTRDGGQQDSIAPPTGDIAEQPTRADQIMQSARERIGQLAGNVDQTQAMRQQAEASSEQAGPSGLGDVAKSLGAGTVRGAANMLDLPGMAFNAAGGAIVSGMERLGLPEDVGTGARLALAGGPLGTGQTARQGMGVITRGGSEYQAQTTPGEYAGTVGEFLPGAAAFGGFGAGNLLRYGVTAGLGSEAAGQMTEGTAAEPYARIVGALAAPVAVQGAGNIARRLVTPNPADPARISLAKVLDDFDVPVTAGQRVGSDKLRRIEGQTSAGQAMQGQQQEAFTAAALRTAGIDARRATPDVLDGASRRIGQVFDDVLGGVDFVPDQASVAKLSNALNTYRAMTPSGNVPPIFDNINFVMAGSAQAGMPVSAALVKNWRSTLSKMTRSPDGATREAAVQAVNALDDATTTALTAMGRADDVARLATARDQWRNLLAIERAATGAGEGAAAGLISPSALRNAVTTQGRTPYARGSRGDIAELARAGEGVIKPLPTSGTAENLRAMMLPGAATSGLGAGIGSMLLGGPAGAMVGGAVGAVAPAVSRAAKMTPVMQRYLANQLVGRGGPAVERRSIGTIASLLAGSGR